MENQIIEYNEVLGLQSDEDLFKAIAEMGERFRGMKIVDAKTDKEVRAARSLVVSKRTAVGNRRKELKAEHLEKGRKIDRDAKAIFALLEPIETPLQAECKRVDKEREERKAEKKRKEQARIDKIRDMISDISNMATECVNKDSQAISKISSELEKLIISKDTFMEFTEEAIKVADETYAKIQDLLVARIQLEKEEEERKAEAERLEKQRKEQEAAQAKIDEENRKIQEEKDRLEEKERVAQAERDRIAKEKAEAEEKARKEALKPDKEKLISFCEQLERITAPTMKTKEAHDLLKAIMFDINGHIARLREGAEAL